MRYKTTPILKNLSVNNWLGKLGRNAFGHQLASQIEIRVSRIRGLVFSSEFDGILPLQFFQGPFETSQIPVVQKNEGFQINSFQ